MLVFVEVLEASTLTELVISQPILFSHRSSVTSDASLPSAVAMKLSALIS